MKKLILLFLTIFCLFQPTLPLLAQEDDPVTQCARGVELFFDGDHNAAYPLLEAGFNGRQNMAFFDPNDLGRCSLALGFLYSKESDWDEALIVYDVAQELFSQTGDRLMEGATLNAIAIIYDSQGKYEEALVIYEKTLAILPEVAKGTTLNNIAGVYDSQGRYTDALLTYTDARVICHEINDQSCEGDSLNGIGAVYASLGRYKEALSTLENALIIRREVNDRLGESATLNNMGDVYHSQGQIEH